MARMPLEELLKKPSKAPRRRKEEEAIDAAPKPEEAPKSKEDSVQSILEFLTQGEAMPKKRLEEEEEDEMGFNPPMMMNSGI